MTSHPKVVGRVAAVRETVGGDVDLEAVRDETFRLRGMFWHKDDGSFAEY